MDGIGCWFGLVRAEWKVRASQPHKSTVIFEWDLGNEDMCVLFSNGLPTKRLCQTESNTIGLLSSYKPHTMTVVCVALAIWRHRLIAHSRWSGSAEIEREREQNGVLDLDVNICNVP